MGIKESILSWLREAGVYKAGVARVHTVPDSLFQAYNDWLADGRNADMDYLAKYSEIRRDPSLLLPGATSIISCAFSYYYPASEMPLKWARYALGDDYHEVIRARLEPVAARIREAFGAECRICVDTAPLFERYWAVEAGLGFIGLNRSLILPGAGSRFFLSEIISTLPLEADSPCSLTCGNCRRCVERCPGKALETEQCKGYDVSQIDSRRCLSYLTIEHRGELPEDVRLGKHIYGCDECQDVCPHNASSPLSAIEEFRPRPAIVALNANDVADMKQEEFSAIFRHSAIKRAKLTGLQRNARRILGE